MMSNKDKAVRDTHSLYLGGMNAVTGYCAMPIISSERLHQNRLAKASKPLQWNWRLWMPRRFRVV